MANLTEVSQWESVIRQIENGEAATGGADGLANMQAKQLANRTKWLKDNLAPIVNAAFSGTLKHGGNDLAGSAIVAKSLGANGYIKYASGLIIQWGEVSLGNIDAGPGNGYYPTLPISFPNRFASSSAQISTSTHTTSAINIITPNNNLELFNVIISNGSALNDVKLHYIAIGY